MEIKKYVPEQVEDCLLQYYQQGWQLLFDNGVTMQQRVLQDILMLGNQSQYAKDHGFAGISTKEEFCAKVPISEYKDYQKYIEKNMRQDNNQLTVQETVYYLLSTGMSNQGKYYIETRLGALARQLSIDIWNMVLTQTIPEMTDPAVKMLAVTNSLPLEKAANGKKVFRTSGKAAKALWERNPQLYVYPYEFLEADISNDDRDYLKALYLLKEKHFNMFFCNNGAYMGVLLDWINKKPQQMINDIRQGYLTAQLSVTDRACLQQSFLPDIQRADELQQLLDVYGTLPLEKVWPALVFGGVWLAGSVGQFSRDALKRFPDTVQYISESYGASEAMFTIPMEFECTYGPLAIYSCYFEFLPLDGSSGPVTMEQMCENVYYEMLITTYSGLYRYNLHDIVKVRGFTGNTANIEFCCRSAECWNLPTGKLYGYTLIQLMQQVELRCDCLFSFYQGLEEKNSFSLLIQPSIYGSSFDSTCFIQELQAQVAMYKIPLKRVFLMKPTYRDWLYQSLMKNGRNMQSVKLPLVAQNIPDAEFISKIYQIA